MPTSAQPAVPAVAAGDADLPDMQSDYISKLSRLERRAEGYRPSGRLQVTSQLHPFWKTKKGYLVVILVVLSIIGGIVGGIIGGTKGNNDGTRKDVGGSQLPPTMPTTTATTSTSTTTPSATPTSLQQRSPGLERPYPVRRKQTILLPLPEATPLSP